MSTTNGSKVEPGQRHTPSRPCAVCGSHDRAQRGQGERCHGFRSGDGRSVFCARAEAPDSIETAAGVLFKHKIAGDCPCGRQHAPPDPIDRRQAKPRRGYRSPQEAARGLGRGLGRLVEGYRYSTAEGRPGVVVFRFEPKTFRPVHLNGDGRWHVGDPPGLLPLYHLDELADAGMVVVSEGERAADAVRALGLASTTSMHGSKSPHRSDWSPLAGKRVAILPDADEPGEAYAAAVVAELAKLDPAPTAKVVRLDGLPPGGDAVEWTQDCGGTAEHLLELIEAAETAELPRTSVDGDGKPPTNEAGQTVADEGRPPFAMTDLGNCERFARDHADVVRHVGSWKKWLVRVGGRWVVDETGAVIRLAKKTVRGIAAEAAGITDPDQFKAALKWAAKSEDARLIGNMVKLAESEKRLAISHRQLNADPWLFNVRNGTIDLRSGTLRDHDRADLITHMAPVDFDPDAKCPLWESELETVFGGDAALVAFFRRLVGYWTTGVVREQVLPIAYGKGRNGKTTTIGTILRILGSDYSYEADPRLIMQGGDNDHPTEKAALFGKRMVSLSETDSGKRLNEALVKRLTGKEQITARRMREDPWSFWPTHKLILSTNHQPDIRGADIAIWRRVLMIPFTVTIDPKDEITDFADRLAKEDSGILAWAVRGCLEWQRDGLNPPESVKAATADYRASQDVLANFISECCTVLKEAKARSGAVYQAYCQWAKENGENSLTGRAFYSAMADRGYPNKVGHANRSFIHGIGLRDDSDQTDPG